MSETDMDQVLPLVAEESMVVGDVPDELDEYGEKVWLEMTPVLDRAGRLKKSDREAWKRYCHTAGRYWRAAADIQARGGNEWQEVPTVAKDEHGKPGVMLRRVPSAAIMDKLAPQLMAMEASFGMTTLARLNLVAKGLRAVPRDPQLPGVGSGVADDDERPDPSAFN